MGYGTSVGGGVAAFRLLPLLRSHDKVYPEGGCHVPGDPLRKIVSMETQHLNELMNHSGTPQLRHISVSLRAHREGGA